MQGGMSNAELTAPQQRVIGKPFKPGQSGNPAGRPKGARSKLSEDFLTMFAADVAEHGPGVIERVRKEKPEAYLRAWVDLLPRKTELDVSLDVSVMHDVSSVVEAYRLASELLGTNPNRSLRRLKTIAPQLSIEHDDER
jgi:hypothetical protein